MRRRDLKGRGEMKRAIAVLIVMVAAVVAGCHAQTNITRQLAPPVASIRPALAMVTSSTVHQNTLNWTQSPDAALTDTANVYAVSGGCPTGTLAVSQFALLKSGVAPSGPFVDQAVTAGKIKSYVITNVIGGVETGVSNCVAATTPTFPAQGLQVTSQ
jgi:hypothetical protein